MAGDRSHRLSRCFEHGLTNGERDQCPDVLRCDRNGRRGLAGFDRNSWKKIWPEFSNQIERRICRCQAHMIAAVPHQVNAMTGASRSTTNVIRDPSNTKVKGSSVKSMATQDAALALAAEAHGLPVKR